MIPFDQWFGTYHDGSKELHEQMQNRLKLKKSDNF